MLFSLASAVLVLLVTASVAMRKGLYRGTILFFSCLFGAVVALAFYENVVAMLNVPFLEQFGEGLTFLVLFVLVAEILTLLSERFLTKSMRLPALIDRIGGGFVGFWTGQLAVGVACISIQMLPWDRNVLGFERLEMSTGTDSWQTNSLLLHSDAFTVALAGYLADNIFSSGNRFQANHPDFLAELAHANMRVQAESKRLVLPYREGQSVFDAITVMWMEDPKLAPCRLTRTKKGETEMTYSKQAQEPEEDHGYLVVRCKLSSASANAEDNYHRFTPQQIRLVGELHGQPKQYYVAGYRDPENMPRHGALGTEQPVVMASGRGEQMFDLVFEAHKDFVPRFVEYKRLARSKIMTVDIETVPVSEILEKLKAAPKLTPGGKTPGILGDDLRKRLKGRMPKGKGRTPSRRPSPKTPPKRSPKKKSSKPEAKKPPPKPRADASKGRVGGRQVQEQAFGNELPFTVSRNEATDQGASVSGSALREGHIVVPATNARGDPVVTTLAVPENARLFQLTCSAQFAKSLFGKAKSFAVKSVSQYVVIAQNGNQYMPVGEIRIASVGGKRMMELQYTSQPEGTRAIRPPRTIKEPQLTGDATVTFLYHIPPGTKLVEFSAGPQALSKSPLNATAPQ